MNEYGEPLVRLIVEGKSRSRVRLSPIVAIKPPYL
jgi:hypothetical protein